ncbi:hypothetical protein BSKO_00763 [Bryopsis sp. KO-2023]|nr:hypothetical protein BSKO_00763 [Bryopsis sp. KO-2023]
MHCLRGFRPALGLACFSAIATGTMNGAMVTALKRKGILKNQAVEDAMKSVDRGLFVPRKESAYQDAPVPIGFGATISAPHMHAHCLELLAEVLKPGARVLDVGSGSGYLTAVMAYMVRDGDKGRVLGVEHVTELVKRSTQCVEQLEFAKEMMETGNLKIIKGDGQIGYSECAPYDCIHVGAAAPEVPQPLVDQLKVGGRLLIPVGPKGTMQNLTMVVRALDGSVQSKEIMEVVYVPLTSLSNQLSPWE